MMTGRLVRDALILALVMTVAAVIGWVWGRDQHTSGPGTEPSSTVTTSTTQHTAPHVAPPVRPVGPHSAIADIDLPADTTPIALPPCGTLCDGRQTEYWHYSVPFLDVVTFLQKQFATGSRYDSYGATRWQGLPPCYDPAHHSPPEGSDGGLWTGVPAGTGLIHEWIWSDGVATLIVQVVRQGIRFGTDPNARTDVGIIVESWPAVTDSDELSCQRA